jgi:DNA-binding NarL/FixJ family response regulator
MSYEAASEEVAMSTIRLAVVDPHPLFRMGVVHTLTHAGAGEVVAEDSATEEALRIAEQFSPDIIITDLHSEFGLGALRRLTSEFPRVRVIILTVHEDRDTVVEALNAGAAGYLLKGASTRELIESVRHVHRGETYVLPSLAARLVQFAAVARTRPDQLPALSSREEDILSCLADAMSNKEISRKLGLSEKTVSHYVATLCEKLQVRNRVEAALVGQRRAQSAKRSRDSLGREV